MGLESKTHRYDSFIAFLIIKTCGGDVVDCVKSYH